MHAHSRKTSQPCWVWLFLSHLPWVSLQKWPFIMNTLDIERPPTSRLPSDSVWKRSWQLLHGSQVDCPSKNRSRRWGTVLDNPREGRVARRARGLQESATAAHRKWGSETGEHASYSRGQDPSREPVQWGRRTCVTPEARTHLESLFSPCVPSQWCDCFSETDLNQIFFFNFWKLLFKHCYFHDFFFLHPLV